MKLLLILLMLGCGSQAIARDLWVEEPKKCAQNKEFPCAIRALEPFRMEKSGQVYHFGRASTVVWNRESEIQLLEGDLWIEKSQGLVLKHTTDTIFKVDGELFLSKSKVDRLEIYNLNGKVEFPKNGFFLNEALAVGFQNWYSGRMQDNRFERGLMKPISFKSFAKQWSVVGEVDKGQRVELLKGYAQLWKNNVDEASQFYQAVVQRRIASLSERASQAEARTVNTEEERRQLLKLYRQKNYISD